MSARSIAVAILLLAPALATAEPPPAPESCALTPQTIPDFELEDVNPTSPTFGQMVQADSFRERVLVIYFAQAT